MQNIQKQKKIYTLFALLLFLGGVAFSGSIFGAEVRKKPLLVTITSPAPSDRIGGSVERDSVLLPEETFPIKGIAAANKSVSLYGWTIIPGTDGNTNPEEVISNFSGETTGTDAIRLSWTVRNRFHQEYADGVFSETDRTCQSLKSHCLPSDGELLGEESLQCEEGNVPVDLDCNIPKKYTVYHDIVHPIEAQLGKDRGRMDILFQNPLSEEALTETKNNTQHFAPECAQRSGCQFDYYPVGWRYAHGPFALPSENTTSPLLSTDLSAMSFHELRVDEANGYIPSIDGEGKTWEEDIVISAQYAPNISADSYSGAYVFSYWNYVRAYNLLEDFSEYTAFTFFPIKDQTILVDGFDQYEIYAIPESEYISAEGVTRENGALVSVVRDPSLSEVVINFSENNLDPSQGYYFAIFEVRDNATVKLPSFITSEVSTKFVSGLSCLGDPEDPVSCPALIGHVLSTNTEILVNLGSGDISSVPSPPKVQKEVFEQSGSYLFDPIVSDRNGELRCGINGYDHCVLPTSRINQFAPQHFLAGTYISDDSSLRSDTDKTFTVQANRSPGIFFDPYIVSEKVATVRKSQSLYGVVFDSWTHEILKNVLVEVQGNEKSTGEERTFSQKTSEDGLFSFNTSDGSYELSVNALQERDDLFLFPSLKYTLSGDTCGSEIPFTDLYCQKNLKVMIENKTIHRDIPLDPTVEGIVSNISDPVRIVLTKNGIRVAVATTVPNGRFSFFVPPGTYEVVSIEALDGKVLGEVQKSITISATPNGSVAAPVSVALSL